MVSSWKIKKHSDGKPLLTNDDDDDDDDGNDDDIIAEKWVDEIG